MRFQLKFDSLKTILLFGFVFRLIATLFSEGYGMFDDHFLIIEASASWANGYDYNNWLPWSTGNTGETAGHNFSYVGINYLFFVVFKFLGIVDPKVLMIFNRLFHALASLLLIYFGFKITEHLSNRKNAVTVGWILALLWLLPFMSVRNLVEMACIPFLMWGIWVLLDSKAKYAAIWAGMLVGIAVSFRYQVGVYSAGVALYYLLKKEYRLMLFFFIGNVATFTILQGGIDFFIWGVPFKEFLGYVNYNMHEGTEYLPNHNYFMYLYVLFGVMLFPFGLLVGFGFFRSARNQWFLFLPTFLFILFHTFYPNRQERFILTVLPLFIILGVIGYQSLIENKTANKLWKFSYRFFWVLNIPLLFLLSFTSSKISRINAMYALYGNSKPNPHILLEASGKANTSMMTKFYSNTWYATFAERKERADTLLNQENFDYIFFFGDEDLNQRLTFYKKRYPNLHLQQACEPSFVDKIAKKLNPRNVNEYIEVWKTNDTIKELR